ncbi:hypothetical protein M0657_001871 [Pyricularia oryzae]|nr:hypothetical protein M0657_001871 [Pyricularia oryzae]
MENEETKPRWAGLLLGTGSIVLYTIQKKKKKKNRFVGNITFLNLIQKRNCGLKANANEAKDEAKAPLVPKLCLGGQVRSTRSRYSLVGVTPCEISSKAAQPSAWPPETTQSSLGRSNVNVMLWVI